MNGLRKRFPVVHAGGEYSFDVFDRSIKKIRDGMVIGVRFRRAKKESRQQSKKYFHDKGSLGLK